MFIFRLIVRQIFRNWKVSAVLWINFCLGFAGFLTLITIKSSVLSSVHQSSKEFLGADLSLYSRYDLQTTQMKKIEALFPSQTFSTNMIEMYSMVRQKNSSRLVLVTAIDPEFPFYGQFEMGSGRLITRSSRKELFSGKNIWVYPELLTQLNLKVGDNLQIGVTKFKITDVVTKSVGQSAGWAALAPMVYMDRRQLMATGLIQKGSTAWRSRLYHLPQQVDIETIEQKIKSMLPDPSIRVASHLTASERASRLIIYFNDFLALAGLVALFFAVAGAIFLVQLYLWNQVENIAIYKSMGLQVGQIQKLYLFQILLLGWTAVIPAIGVAWVLVTLLKSYLIDVSLVDLEITGLGISSLLTFVVITIICLLAFLPLLTKVRSVSAKVLFSEAQMVGTALRQKWVLHYSPLFFAFWLLSVWLSSSLKVGSGFFIALIAALLGIGLIFWFVFRGWARVWRPQRWSFKLFQWQILRRPQPLVVFATCVGFCVLLLNFIFSLEKGLQIEILPESKEARPSLFLFDIQEDQLSDLKKLISQQGHEFTSVSPMIRAKLERVNGTEFSQLTTDRFFETREKEREERFRNRGMNLSYRSSLSNSESLIAGKDFQGHFDAEKQSLPEVSLEYRFADRLNLNLGDILEFDVQGVSVKGVVNSLRKVKWTSFQPNFFIQFPTGVLEGAPKTFIATLPTLEESMKNKLQAQVVDAFPNISLIDVSRLVERILTIVDKMSGALKLMLILTLITGFVVVFSVSQSQVQSRQQEMILMKMLGVDYRSQWHSYCLEVVILSFCAATVGFILNYILIAVVSHYFFNTIFLPDLSFGFGLLVGVPILVLMVLGVTLRQLFRRPTAEWL